MGARIGVKSALSHKKTPLQRAALSLIQSKVFGLEAKTSVFAFELRHSATLVEQARVAACPCGVRRRVDIECKLVALGTPSGFHFDDRTVGHFDVDHVVFWVCIFFHDRTPYAFGAL